jgi:FtsP/CotA-like multicopper oxidase with cupredoxin domain
MKQRTLSSGLALVLALGLVACGQDEPDDTMPRMDTPGMDEPAGMPRDTVAGQPGAMGEMPSWFRVNGNQVQMDIVAGANGDNNYWNFNGAANGGMTITVPEGAQVTINFRNDDPNMVHSVGVAEWTSNPPAAPPAESVFGGAISSNPTSATDATATGQSETITFTADRAGQYSLFCYVPGHGVSGMWVRFNVGGQPGVTGAPNVQISMD